MKYYVLDYANGNRRIELADVIRREEKEFILTECYTPEQIDEIKLETAEAFNEWLESKIDTNISQYLKGIIEAEQKPNWNQLEYNTETGEYILKE